MHGDEVCRTRAMAATQSACFSRLPTERWAGEVGRGRRRVQVPGVLVRKLFVISNEIQMGNQGACVCGIRVCVGVCEKVYSRLSDMEYVVCFVFDYFSGYKLTLCRKVEKEEQRKEQVVGIN